MLERERQRSQRGGTSFGIAVIDLQAMSHLERVRRHLARTLESELRLTDEAGWLANNVLGVLLRGTSERGASTL